MRRYFRDNQRNLSLDCIVDESREFLSIVMGPIVGMVANWEGREAGRGEGKKERNRCSLRYLHVECHISILDVVRPFKILHKNEQSKN